jgi:hypothetical protein
MEKRQPPKAQDDEDAGGTLLSSAHQVLVPTWDLPLDVSFGGQLLLADLSAGTENC